MDYTLRRIEWSKNDEDLEKFAHILSAMHACHRKGPEHFWELGAQIAQAYKAIEQRQRDGEWTVAWSWTGLVNPRPSKTYQRGLALPGEFAASVANLREMQTLSTYRSQLNKGGRVDTRDDDEAAKAKKKKQQEEKRKADAAAKAERDGKAEPNPKRRGRGGKDKDKDE